MSERIPVCALNEIVPGAIRGASLPDGARIALYNIHGTIYATDDTCTHEAASLSEEGAIEGDEVVCGWHFCSFDVASGEPCAAPCSEPLRTYRVAIIDGVVHVER